MKLRSLVVAVVLALPVVALVPGAHAQTGLYINPVAMRISNSVADNGLFAFLGQGNTSHMFYGVQLGGYYDFKTPYPFRAGLDVRDSIVHGGGASLNSFLVGIRISGHPFRNQHWKPYIEPIVGAGTSEAPQTAIKVTKAQYGVYGGVDYETHHHIDFRVAELGYTGLRTASSETIGESATIPTSGILTISTGIVFRFP